MVCCGKYFFQPSLPRGVFRVLDEQNKTKQTMHQHHNSPVGVDLPVFRVSLASTGDMACLRQMDCPDCWLLLTLVRGIAHVRVMSLPFLHKYPDLSLRLRGNHYALAPSLTLEVCFGGDDNSNDNGRISFMLFIEQTPLLRAETSVDKVCLDVWRKFCSVAQQHR